MVSSEGGVVVERDQVRSLGSSRRKTAISTVTVSAADLPSSRAASMNPGLAFLEDRHRPRLAAYLQVTLTVTGLVALGDNAAQLTSSTATPPRTPRGSSRQSFSPFCPGRWTKAWIVSVASRPHPRSSLRLSQPAICSGLQPSSKPVADEAPKVLVALEDGQALPALG